MRRALVLLLVLGMVAAVPGCTPRMAGAFVFGMALATSIRVHAHHDHELVHEREIVYVTVPATEPTYLPPRDTVETDPPVKADIGVFRSALGDAPVASCKERGLSPGYGHAKVTFGPDGHPTKVAIDAPPNLGPEAVGCVGEKLGAVVVPPFDGAPVSVGTTWYVR
jgi:hypothetical protein